MSAARVTTVRGCTVGLGIGLALGLLTGDMIFRLQPQPRAQLPPEQRRRLPSLSQRPRHQPDIPPGFAPLDSIHGNGNVPGHDMRNAPQPGNVSMAECARVCKANLDCDAFTWFAKPPWSAVSECYLKTGCLAGKLEPFAGARTFYRKGNVECDGAVR